MKRLLKNLSDEDLITHLKKGDQVAFEEIYERYWATLYRIAYYKLNSEEVAEELVQDLFTALWQRRETLTIDSLKNYLFISIRNQIISYIRKRVVQEKFVANRSLSFDYDTEWRVAYNELVRRIETALKELPEKTKTIFQLSRFEDQSIPEIARQIESSEKTVEYHLSKALKHLRAQIRIFAFSAILLFVLGIQ